MNCINCGKNFYELIETFKNSDKINEFGRREMQYTAVLKDNVHWKDGKFHCDNCGASFTFREAVQGKS